MKQGKGLAKLSRRLGPYALALAVLAAAEDARAAEPRCPLGKTPVRVTVESDPGKVTYDRTLNRRRLTALAGQSGSSSRHPGERVLGLTQSVHAFNYAAQTQTLAVGKGRVCARLGAVRLKARFTRLKVYILRKYVPGTCQYNAVLAHEHLHVDAARQTLARHLPRIERRLGALARRMPPAFADTTQRASNRVMARLKSSLRPAISAFERELRRMNRKIDSRVNYARFQRKCRKW